ncbi:FAD-binding oxidoreductase [Limoniibacter endophyticus]|uniref:D-2-hydroxyacid dehydrogenase n=1 Tax=Limoniibacter endophyticus TaxID=1565040 RepID=A0A8J3DIT8_9HYPH|nr:FAD-binding oxidoreductase [Limoniibacter endophyticus]GHC71384.1 D-2-hydroxyacid dehydrogenase [Limoniibacter endophyticus]
MDGNLKERFRAIVGDAYLIDAPADMVSYATEPRGLFGGSPSLVLRPGTVEEVSRILALANETRTPIVPQGGNTGLVGGQMASSDGSQVVLSLARLNRIREIDGAGRTMTVDAGVLLQNIQQSADDAGLLFPLSLASEGSCQIGGNLSVNAGGTAVLAYGNARELCLGLEVVLPDGTVLDDLRKLKKDNTGYDLKNLFIGAEGTLGIITGAVLKLVPKPKGKGAAWVGVNSPQAALALFNLAEQRAGSALTGFELMADVAFSFAIRHLEGARAPLEGEHAWHVLMQISSGRSQDDADQLMQEILEEAFESGVVEDAAIAASLAQAKEFWRLREELSDVQKREGGSIKHDISVPVSKIPAFIEQGAAAVQSVCPDARLAAFGHMGDGNLHFNVSQPVGSDTKGFLALYRQMNDAVHRVVRSFNGSISAEHGIGQMKREELAATAPAPAIALMRAIKDAVDPNGIMNPGKVI